jgi:hypothetical protein
MTKNDPQSEPHVRDTRNDPPQKSGTDQPWKNPGQAAQDPSQQPKSKHDLEQWQRTNTH